MTGNSGDCCSDTCNESGGLKAYLATGASFALLLAGIIISYADASWFDRQTVRFAWYVAAYLPVGLPVFREAWHTIRRRDIFSEYTLMGIATIGAFAIGEYPEAVAVMLFYAIGELFQSRAVGRAQRSISALMDVRPEKTTVITGGRSEEVAPHTVGVGEAIEVRTGERVPLDGVLLSDGGTFDTAALTGESLPRHIEKGGEVLAGMIAADRVVRIEVTKPYGESTLSRILQMVQQAAERKAPAEMFIRRFARIYTPIVTLLAALLVVVPYIWSLTDASFTYSFDEWFSRALVFLVISCPCALVISIPLGYFGGIGAASHHGILFKGGNWLDAITRVKKVVFDKTGTLTDGEFRVTEIVPAKGFGFDELLRLAASAESLSNHPIAAAIVKHAAAVIVIPTPSQVAEKAGQGITATVDSRKVLAGNARLMDANSISYPYETAAGTAVLCAVDGKYAGTILLSDRPKDDAADSVAQLRRCGVGNITILSGDKQATVTELGIELGVTAAYGGLLPEDKVSHIERIEGEGAGLTAFVGDGINDAPAIAASDVGIAMGGLGNDAAIETADVVIQSGRPSKVAVAIRIGKATRRIVWQNITLAFAVKAAVLVLGAGGLATMWEAVFADVGVALLAIFNAVRIQRQQF